MQNNHTIETTDSVRHSPKLRNIVVAFLRGDKQTELIALVEERSVWGNVASLLLNRTRTPLPDEEEEEYTEECPGDSGELQQILREEIFYHFTRYQKHFYTKEVFGRLTASALGIPARMDWNLFYDPTRAEELPAEVWRFVWENAEPRVWEEIAHGTRYKPTHHYQVAEGVIEYVVSLGGNSPANIPHRAFAAWYKHFVSRLDVANADINSLIYCGFKWAHTRWEDAPDDEVEFYALLGVNSTASALGRRGKPFQFPELISPFQRREWAQARTHALVAEGRFDAELPDVQTAITNWGQLSPCRKYAAILKFGGLEEKTGAFDPPVKVLQAGVPELRTNPNWSYVEYDDAVRL